MKTDSKLYKSVSDALKVLIREKDIKDADGDRAKAAMERSEGRGYTQLRDDTELGRVLLEGIKLNGS